VTPGTTIETTTLTDVGTLCWNQTGDLQVDFQQCLSSSCDTLLAVECTTSLEDDVLLVTATAVIESVMGGGCTNDCGSVTATCEITDDWLEGAQIRARYGTVDTPLEQIQGCF
jgi:hypothetical protein